MDKTCRKCNQPILITDDDQAFYKKMDVPEPTLCPGCRMQRRTAFRNERNLYKRKCDFSGKEILSIRPPTSKYKVYDQSIWWSDKWDPLEYGQDYDFDKPFFKQLQQLFKKVPQINLQNRNNENSDYCNDTSDMKNSYLCFNSETSENCYHLSSGGFNSKDCTDLFWCLSCELCYECAKVIGGYHCFWCFNCRNISDCYFSEDLRGCNNCFGCIGLRQKEYCIYNKQVPKEEFEKFINDFEFTHSNIENAKQKVAELRLKIPCKNLQIQNSENCLGDFIEDSKNCIECFDLMNSENCKYVWDGIVDNTYDCFNVGIDSSYLYECIGVYRSNNLKFCIKCTGSFDLSYCSLCFFSENSFGCTGLKHKKYCILNKQYTKEEYEELLPKIIEHMKSTGEYGEFFPVSSSPCGYNDSRAIDYFPLEKEEAVKQGFNWNEYESPKPEGSNTTIKCENDGKLFKIIPQELKFYKKHNLPIPNKCPDCRHSERKAQIQPRKLWTRRCHKSGIEIKTNFAPDCPEKVVSEKSYLEQVY